MTNTTLKTTLLLAGALALGTAAVAQAPQQPDGPTAPPHGHGQHMRHGGGDMPFGGKLFWKDPQTVQALNLSADQQAKIDGLFTQSRNAMIDQHAALQKDELALRSLMDSDSFNAGQAQSLTDRIADQRASLEKTHEHFLISARSVLTADQWTKLKAMHPMGGGHGDKGGKQFRRGPGGPGGPGAPPSGDDLESPDSL